MKRSILLGITLLMSWPAWGLLPPAITPAEQAMCEARVYSRLGERNQNTMHMHHHCGGLRYLDRAYAAMGNKSDMNHYLNNAISNFDYVLGHTSEDFVWRGDVHLGKGRALKLLGRKAAAMVEFNQALRYEMGAAEAYQELADYYLELGNKKKALEMATEGLRRKPDSKSLKRRYTELGGQMPYPEPLAQTSSALPKSEMPATVSPQMPPPTHADDGVNSGASTDRTDEAPKQSQLSEPPTQQIGSPKNPYCRFCPE